MDKTSIQHAGTVGFAMSTVMGAASAIGKVGGAARLAREIPGLNLAVGAVEVVNTIHQGSLGQDVVAMGHAGNAAGCLASFAEDVGRFVALESPAGYPMLGHVAVGLGVAGGLFGIVQGSTEIKAGLKTIKETGSARNLNMGIADAASGGATVAGIALHATGTAPGVGTALLVAASVCDLASIVVDYTGWLKDRRETRQAS